MRYFLKIIQKTAKSVNQRKLGVSCKKKHVVYLCEIKRNVDKGGGGFSITIFYFISCFRNYICLKRTLFIFNNDSQCQ